MCFGSTTVLANGTPIKKNKSQSPFHETERPPAAILTMLLSLMTTKRKVDQCEGVSTSVAMNGKAVEHLSYDEWKGGCSSHVLNGQIVFLNFIIFIGKNCPVVYLLNSVSKGKILLSVYIYSAEYDDFPPITM